MFNYWLDVALTPYENELILVTASPTTKQWYDKIQKPTIPAICPDTKPTNPNMFSPVVGQAHHLRLTKWGIEGVLKAPKKYHRYSLYVLYDCVNQPNEPFWIVLYR